MLLFKESIENSEHVLVQIFVTGHDFKKCVLHYVNYSIFMGYKTL